MLYSVMMYIRMLIIMTTGILSHLSTMWAVRYCSVRRQFSTQNGTKDERKIIDYQTTQHIFGPLLGRSFVDRLLGVHISSEFHKMMQAVKQQNFKMLEVMHHLLSGFKSLITDETMKNIDQARRACGGAGFSANSGFADTYYDTSPMPTYEGDNVVMMGQASRLLMKFVKKVESGKKVPFPFEYLNKAQQTLTLRSKCVSKKDFLSLDLL